MKQMSEIKTEIKAIPEGVFTGELTVKQRKSKYDFDALLKVVKAGGKYVLPANVTAETTAINIRKRLAEKGVTANYGTAQGTKQYVIFPAPKTEKKVKS